MSILDDSEVEGDERLVVTVESSLPGVDIVISNATVLIIDNDSEPNIGRMWWNMTSISFMIGQMMVLENF